MWRWPKGLSALGAEGDKLEDGWRITGRSRLSSGGLNLRRPPSTMALAVAALAADSPVDIEDPECVAISYPGFFSTLDRLTGGCS